MNLTATKKRAIFKTLANKSQYAVGLEFGFDKFYDSNIAVVNAVNKVYREIKDRPEEFAISTEVLDLVERGMESRRNQGSKGVIRDPEGHLEVDEKRLVIGVRNKAWLILDKKLDFIMKNKGAFNRESLMSIGKLAGIAFDKGQIVQGQATEHIALKAKVDQNITAEDALAQLMKFREASLSEQD